MGQQFFTFRPGGLGKAAEVLMIRTGVRHKSHEGVPPYMSTKPWEFPYYEPRSRLISFK
jgi:hypothetical protein